ncbi:protein translocase subunit SecF [Aminivibrio sp.]|jgi:preprotein translocase subunit SecF|uniref:protein translocase subunit SecF n=1 Tax=Aminivibrio sp. TaxID=1872489 RepID=UPI001A5BF730|nr:protein translocase subunit SecF [Aminivibrio sp.]MBL3539092.1 protein translocase subunit SecF [Aminivibrio sp.]MDK2959503.1 preprotein translocase subunit SecF [Synergistaceae bacterium]
MRISNINFMQHRKTALLLSLVCVVASLGLIFFKGLNLGIDFTGGNVVQAEFAQPTAIEDIRQVLNSVGQGGSVIQSYSERGVIIRISANEEEARKQAVNALRTKFPGIQIIRLEKVGPVVGAELRQEAFIALILALAGILAYITVRFQFRFAVVSVAALLHDAVITLGIFSITGMEISSSFIAAILTIVGYSLNDTIVVLDRIRENWKNLRREGIVDLLNNSINQTISRTINTSVTTLLPVVALYVWGGEVLRSFSFALLVGILVGTYSSIYVASGLLAEWWMKSPQKG